MLGTQSRDFRLLFTFPLFSLAVRRPSVVGRPFWFFIFIIMMIIIIMIFDSISIFLPPFSTCGPVARQILFLLVLI